MCEATIWLTVLVCFYLLQFICSCENLYKNKVWGQTMEAFPVSPCQGFNFHAIKCFHQWPSAHSFNSKTYPISYCWRWGVGHLCTATVLDENRHRRRSKGGGGVPQPPGLPTDVWTKTFKRSAGMSFPSFNRPCPLLVLQVLKESSWVGGWFDLGHLEVKLFPSC